MDVDDNDLSELSEVQPCFMVMDSQPDESQVHDYHSNHSYYRKSLNALTALSVRPQSPVLGLITATKMTEDDELQQNEGQANEENPQQQVIFQGDGHNEGSDGDENHSSSSSVPKLMRPSSQASSSSRRIQISDGENSSQLSIPPHDGSGPVSDTRTLSNKTSPTKTCTSDMDSASDIAVIRSPSKKSHKKSEKETEFPVKPLSVSVADSITVNEKTQDIVSPPTLRREASSLDNTSTDTVSSTLYPGSTISSSSTTLNSFNTTSSGSLDHEHRRPLTSTQLEGTQKEAEVILLSSVEEEDACPSQQDMFIASPEYDEQDFSHHRISTPSVTISSLHLSGRRTFVPETSTSEEIPPSPEAFDPNPILIADSPTEGQTESGKSENDMHDVIDADQEQVDLQIPKWQQVLNEEQQVSSSHSNSGTTSSGTSSSSSAGNSLESRVSSSLQAQVQSMPYITTDESGRSRSASLGRQKDITTSSSKSSSENEPTHHPSPEFASVNKPMKIRNEMEKSSAQKGRTQCQSSSVQCLDKTDSQLRKPKEVPRLEEPELSEDLFHLTPQKYTKTFDPVVNAHTRTVVSEAPSLGLYLSSSHGYSERYSMHSNLETRTSSHQKTKTDAVMYDEDEESEGWCLRYTQSQADTESQSQGWSKSQGQGRSEGIAEDNESCEIVEHCVPQFSSSSKTSRIDDSLSRDSPSQSLLAEPVPMEIADEGTSSFQMMEESEQSVVVDDERKSTTPNQSVTKDTPAVSPVEQSSLHGDGRENENSERTETPAVVEACHDLDEPVSSSVATVTTKNKRELQSMVQQGSEHSVGFRFNLPSEGLLRPVSSATPPSVKLRSRKPRHSTPLALSRLSKQEETTEEKKEEPVAAKESTVTVKEAILDDVPSLTVGVAGPSQDENTDTPVFHLQKPESAEHSIEKDQTQSSGESIFTKIKESKIPGPKECQDYEKRRHSDESDDPFDFKSSKNGKLNKKRRKVSSKSSNEKDIKMLHERESFIQPENRGRDSSDADEKDEEESDNLMKKSKEENELKETLESLDLFESQEVGRSKRRKVVKLIDSQDSDVHHDVVAMPTQDSPRLSLRSIKSQEVQQIESAVHSKKIQNAEKQTTQEMQDGGSLRKEGSSCDYNMEVLTEPVAEEETILEKDSHPKSRDPYIFSDSQSNKVPTPKKKVREKTAAGADGDHNGNHNGHNDNNNGNNGKDKKDDRASDKPGQSSQQPAKSRGNDHPSDKEPENDDNHIKTSLTHRKVTRRTVITTVVTVKRIITEETIDEHGKVISGNVCEEMDDPIIEQHSSERTSPNGMGLRATSIHDAEIEKTLLLAKSGMESNVQTTLSTTGSTCMSSSLSTTASKISTSGEMADVSSLSKTGSSLSLQKTSSSSSIPGVSLSLSSISRGDSSTGKILSSSSLEKSPTLSKGALSLEKTLCIDRSLSSGASSYTSSTSSSTRSSPRKTSLVVSPSGLKASMSVMSPVASSTQKENGAIFNKPVRTYSMKKQNSNASSEQEALKDDVVTMETEHTDEKNATSVPEVAQGSGGKPKKKGRAGGKIVTTPQIGKQTNVNKSTARRRLSATPREAHTSSSDGEKVTKTVGQRKKSLGEVVMGLSRKDSASTSMASEALPHSTERTQTEDCLPDLVAGVRVFTRWPDGYYYPGIVVKKDDKNGRFIVKFDDGDTRPVSEKNIFIKEWLDKHQSVMAMSSDEEYFEPGIVVGYYKDKDTDEEGYVVEKDEGHTKRYPRKKVILTADQAHSYIANKLSTPSKTSASVSLDNLVIGKRSRSGSYIPTRRRIRKTNRTTNTKTPEKVQESVKRKLDDVTDDAEKDTPKKRGKPPKPKIPVVAGEATIPSVAAPQSPSVTSLRRSPRKTNMPSPARVSPLKSVTQIQELPGPSKAEPTRALRFSSPARMSQTTKVMDTISASKNLFSAYAFLLTCGEKKKFVKPITSPGESTDESVADEEPDIPFEKEAIKKLIKDGGGKVLNSFDEAVTCRLKVYLLANTYCRTKKYFQCLAAGIPCVSFLWLSYSCKLNNVLDVPSYLLPAGENIETETVMELQQTQNIFDGIRFLVLSRNSKDPEYEHLWRSILVAAKCKKVVILPQDFDISKKPRTSLNFDIIVADHTLPQNLEDKAKELRIPIVSCEWVIQSLICGQRRNFQGHPKYDHRLVHN